MNLNSRNRHLNLYQFFSPAEVIENNLTRGLAICLQNNPLFFKTFLAEVVGQDTANSLLGHVDEGESAYINIQEKVANIRNRQEEIGRLFGITLTTGAIDVALAENRHEVNSEGSGSITDIFLQLKDVGIVIEAKRHDENCSPQLAKQLAECGRPVEAVKSLTWERVLEMLIAADNIHQLLSKPSVFIQDFIKLIETHYVDWLPTLPFSQLPAPKDHGDLSKHYKRLEQIKNSMDVELLSFRDRTPIPINVDWASEVVPYFTGQDEQGTLSVYVWPASIKAQGYSLYNKDQSWQNQKKLQVGEHIFPLRIIPEIVFRHFNAFISGIKLGEGPSKLHNRDNFYWSGKKKREEWPALERWFDENIGGDWREKCQWREKFLETDRNYLTMSFGFEVIVDVPYNLLQELDKSRSNPKPVADLLSNIVKALEQLIV